MKRRAPCVFVAATIALSLALSNRGVAEPAAAVPVGYITYPLTTGATIAIGVPLLDLPTFTGLASEVTSDTLSATDVAWTPGEFTDGAAPYFVTIRSGAQAGRTLLVTGNTATTLTVDIEDTALDTSGFSVAPTADAFELFRGNTLGTLFGSAADANGILTSGLKGSTSRTTADNVQIHSGTGFLNYWYNTNTSCWVQAGGGTVNRNDILLYPDDGVLITRRGGAAELSFLGRVPSSALKTRLPGGTTSVVGVRFPADTTLGSLDFGAPGSWITGANRNTADNIKLWNGVAWEVYYKNTANQWIKTGTAGVDQSAKVIAAGNAIQIVKRGTATGPSSFFTQALPYGL